MINRPLLFEYHTLNNDLDELNTTLSAFDDKYRERFESFAFGTAYDEDLVKEYNIFAKEYATTVQKIMSMVTLNYCRNTWKKFGKQTFLIRKNLMHLLEHTDPKVSGEYFSMPYESFAIQFDKLFLDLGIGEVYVTSRMVGKKRLLTICVVYKIDKDGLAHGYTDFQYYLPDDKTIVDDLQTINEEIKSKKLEDIEYTEALFAAVKLAINIVLYINAGAEPLTEKLHPGNEQQELKKKLSNVKNKGKAKKLFTRLSRISGITKIVVGDQFENADYDITPHWVRGYFKHYTHEKFKESLKMKPVWIKPYFKACGGDGVTPVLGVRTYDVG